MINPNATHDEVVAEADRLEAAYAAEQSNLVKGKKARPTGGWGVTDLSPDFEAARDELVAFRSYWRAVGEMQNIGHPGRRDFVKSENNTDGSN